MQHQPRATTSPATTTTIGLTRFDKALVLIGAPLIGLLLGWVLPPGSDWISNLPWMPVRGPFNLIASWDARWVPLLLMTVCVVAGLVVALLIFDTVLEIDVDDEQVTFRSGDRHERALRRDVQAVFYDGKQVVLVDAADRELLRGEPERKRAYVEAVFRQYGYPWLDDDPYASQFTRWDPDTVDLPPGANALFAARALAHRKHAEDDLHEFRAALAALDVVVRDAGKTQFWRRSGESMTATRPSVAEVNEAAR